MQKTHVIFGLIYIFLIWSFLSVIGSGIKSDDDAPCVTKGTYTRLNSGMHIRGCYQLQNKYCLNENDLPVFMRGSWEVMQERFGTHDSFRWSVVERFIRFYKLTVFNQNDAGELQDKIRDSRGVY